MSRIPLILFTLLFISTPIFSQNKKTEKPDYKKIEKTIQKEKLTFFYPKLMQRFEEADTSMNLNEKRHLYYGYIFQENYSPYGHSVFMDSLRPLLQKKHLEYDELQKMVAFSDSILKENPFNLRAINYQLYAYDQLANQKAIDKKAVQLNTVIDALLSTGDGLEKKSAYYVICTEHEYDLLNILGFQYGGRQSLIEHYDYLTVGENPEKIEGLYFDVSPCLNHLNDMFK